MNYYYYKFINYGAPCAVYDRQKKMRHRFLAVTFRTTPIKNCNMQLLVSLLSLIICFIVHVHVL